MNKKQVGDKIIDKNGNEWVIARIWEHEKWWDFELINNNTYGSLREFKPKTI